MAEEQKVERLFTVNLSEAYSHQKTKRAPWALAILRSFIARHFKASESDVRLSQNLASFIGARGIQRPERSVKVRAIKSGNLIRVYLKDEKIEEQKKEEVKEQPKETKKEEPKPTEKTEQKPVEKKEQKKEPVKESKQEQKRVMEDDSKK